MLQAEVSNAVYGHLTKSREDKCPKCETEFKAADNRVYKGVVKDLRDSIHVGHDSPENWINESAMVKCPNCE